MQAHGNTPEIRVLLVDDEEDDYLITSEALADCRVAHYDVTWSSSFEDAQQQLSSNTFDLCLADYYLGCHTGLDLLNALGEVPLVRRAPLILLTGAGDRALDLKAMELGAADYLLKSELRSNPLERAIRHAIERHDAQRKLYQLARYDHLTGLPNRANFRESLLVTLHRARRNNTTAALLFVDIDHFKPVNDTMGHDAGDELLRVATGRMLNSVRVVDAVSCLGGDEFTVVLSRATRRGYASGLRG